MSDLPTDENIYNTECPIIYAMRVIGAKWKLPIVWYLGDAENCTLSYGELYRRVVGVTATMLTKSLRELERDGLIVRTQFDTKPPTVDYSLTETGCRLIPALRPLYDWAEDVMQENGEGSVC